MEMDGREELVTEENDCPDTQSFPSLLRHIASRSVAGFDVSNSPEIHPAIGKALRFEMEMDGRENFVTEENDCPDPQSFPSLLRRIASRSVAGFDVSNSPEIHPAIAEVPKATDCDIHSETTSSLPPCSPNQMIGQHHNAYAISISMPLSTSDFQLEHSNAELESQNGTSYATSSLSNDLITAACLQEKKKVLCHSQPLILRNSYSHATKKHQIPRSRRFRDKRYDSFKTWSRKLERQISNPHEKPQESEELSDGNTSSHEPVPVDRFFDALEGPELDKLKASEELLLPEDKKWPFLLRFPITSFAMCLGFGSQAILWKTLATSPSTRFLHVSLIANLVLWCISVFLLFTISATYALKFLFYFRAVSREYYNPIRVNFFFAPWIAILFLVIGLPPSLSISLHVVVWYVLMAPILILELKIYGQWMSGGQRRLSKVANPTNHLSVIGNFVGALLGASLGLKEGPIFFFAVGLAHYIVLFVTLYQRLPTNETLPRELHPVFFLFVAAPNLASMAWANITGDFDYCSKIAYFIGLFLYASLAVRINFFRGFRFSLAWWAYTSPMTGASIATIRYSTEVSNLFTRILTVTLSAISTIIVAALLTLTVVHALVLRDLFPNDIPIAISVSKPKQSNEHMPTRTPGFDNTDVDAYASADNEAPVFSASTNKPEVHIQIK